MPFGAGLPLPAGGAHASVLAEKYRTGAATVPPLRVTSWHCILGAVFLRARRDWAVTASRRQRHAPKRSCFLSFPFYVAQCASPFFIFLFFNTKGMFESTD